MNSLIGFVLSGGGMAITFLACSLWLGTRPRSLRSRRLVVIIAALYGAGSIYGVSHGAHQLWRAGFQPFTESDVPRGHTAVVVLGAGSVMVRDWNNTRLSIPDPPGLTRILEGARVYQLVNADWIVSLLGASQIPWTDQPNAITTRDVLLRFGVPQARIVVDARPRTTREEVVFISSLLPSLGVDRVILVTSASHMRRSVGAFRAAGLSVIPAIAREHRWAHTWCDWIVPSERGLESSAALIHEILGLVYYAARGWYSAG